MAFQRRLALAELGEASSAMSTSSSASSDASPVVRPRWTSILRASPELASLNKQHLEDIPEYDRYLVSLGRKIGEGGQGEVFEAKFHLPHFFRPVRVVVKKFRTFDGVSQGHFPRELMQSFKSRYNLCMPFGDFYDEQSLHMMLKPFSCDLRAAIDSRLRASREDGLGTNASPFGEDGGRLIILQVAMALKALHGHGTYHGDLKADNILIKIRAKNYDISVSNVAHVVLADFERSEGVVGTAFYRAPEVLRSLLTGVPLSTEQWLMADVYSFGMVCYEVLTGEIPFEGHPQSDYDLVLNCGRPELSAHLPQSWRDVILRCWHPDPQCRPGWDEIMEAFMLYDDALVTEEIKIVTDDFKRQVGLMALPMSHVNKPGKAESLTLESLIHEVKHMIRTQTLLHEGHSKRFKMEFMPFYWASEFVATVEEYASKFEVGSSGGGSPRRIVCNCQEVFERVKLVWLMAHQMLGSAFVLSAFRDLIWEEDMIRLDRVWDLATQTESLHAMLVSIFLRVAEELQSCVEATKELQVGTSWTYKLSFCHGVVKWLLWYEHAGGKAMRAFVMDQLLPTHNWSLGTVIQSILLLFCIMGNAYIYVVAMMTWEPLLLGLQYGLYKVKGSNNVLYRSSGERRCRFQRLWLNSTRLWTRSKGLSIIVVFFLILLFAMCGLKGILVWILFPSAIIYTPYWRQSLIVGI